MYKKFFGGVLISVFTFSVLLLTFAQNQPKKDLITVTGVIKEIAEDGSYIVVDDGVKGTKFITTKEFIEEEYLEVGDKVKASGEETSKGIELKDYEYSYDDDSPQGIETEVNDFPVDSPEESE